MCGCAVAVASVGLGALADDAAGGRLRRSAPAPLGVNGRCVFGAAGLFCGRTDGRAALGVGCGACAVAAALSLDSGSAVGGRASDSTAVGRTDGGAALGVGCGACAAATALSRGSDSTAVGRTDGGAALGALRTREGGFGGSRAGNTGRFTASLVTGVDRVVAALGLDRS